MRASTATTPYKITPQLTAWTVITVDEVEKLIGSAPTKTMPTRPGPYMASKGRAQSAVAFRRFAV